MNFYIKIFNIFSKNLHINFFFILLLQLVHAVLEIFSFALIIPILQVLVDPNFFKKLSDIANQFAYYKGQLLGLPDNAISIFDEDIQLALDNKDASGKSQGSVMSLNDYAKLLRTISSTKPLWLKSPGSREEASGYANDILRMFGLRS
jgi:hypothetical protein